MVLPDYAMLTGLNEQHLEKFGSLENEIEGESESVDFVLGHRAQGSGSKAVVNVGNKYIKERWEGKEGVVGYGEGAFETPMKQNIAGAKVMAKVLGMELSLIEAAGRKLMSPKHRLNVSVRGDLTIIDDAFSSNTDGFRAAVDYLNSFDGHKVIVTPGIVELGGETARIHMELGV
jgi:UDP-N-acetylmuramoyl-tripeptide--D-alanyl-D-alanine ligase